MYHGAGDPRGAQRSFDTPAGFSLETTARAVLARIRKLFDAYTPGMPVERTRPPDALASALSDLALERERLFALGWLNWLNEDWTAAESLLAQAMGRAREENVMEALAESAYWCARVRLLLGRPQALTEFESVLRTLGGSPRATIWFVDLLWRAGRLDRAEQVWKSVRGSRRVADCVEGPLLEARTLLRRGERMPAERLLNEATPTNGIVWVERLLLLAWIAVTQKQHDKARSLLQQAREGPYPATALQTWTEKVEQRISGELGAEGEASRSHPALRDFRIGQQARGEGKTEEAIVAYRSALSSPAAQPFARYALACLGEDDLVALLASQPGLFLAVRCRARLILERFRRREVRPAECLDALQQAAVTGYRDAAAEHFRCLATALQQSQPDAAFVRELAAQPNADAAARNRFRVALELAVRLLPVAVTRQLLIEWSRREDLEGDLRSVVGRQLLRLLLLGGTDDEMRAAVEHLLPGEALLTLASRGHQPSEFPRGTDDHGSPGVRLWHAAQTIDQHSTEPEPWRQRVRMLRSHSRWKGVAQSLLLQEAAQRGEVAVVLALLDEVDAWRSLSTPPRFVLRVLESVRAAQPDHPGWRRSLARWLSLWDLSALSTLGATLAMHAGLTAMRGETAEPPPGIPVVPWFLHQAARALGRDDASAALAFMRRALALDLASVPEACVVHDALPEWERRVRAANLAAVVEPASIPTALAAGVLVDVVEALSALPDGATIGDTLIRGDLPAVRARLDALSEQPDVSPRLAHHLALLMQRSARSYEESENPENAVSYWRRSWLGWLHFFALAPHAEARRIVLDFLLEQHRHRINDLLARNAVDAARKYWNLVRELPVWASRVEEGLGRDLVERIERFREELATEYLLTTREAMRFGSVPEGWRADYEKGLGYLRRLLSLDRDNPRLLAALIEICNDWFLDLYHLGDPATLREQVHRFTPFALQLARRIGAHPGDLSARASLADFWKFRGFLAADREQKTALYREALRFNPANNNVRDLLAELDPPRTDFEDRA
jgi:hypothetical protein